MLEVKIKLDLCGSITMKTHLASFMLWIPMTELELRNQLLNFKKF
uniref:Uncharacterized protein n=1 Tax=Arcella intermedia TaxID=1963864 RepID=A0A6B2LU28_9EUKA